MTLSPDMFSSMVDKIRAICACPRVDFLLRVLPILPIGIYLGKLLNKKLSDRLFYHISHSALFLCGLNLISQQIL